MKKWWTVMLCFTICLPMCNISSNKVFSFMKLRKVWRWDMRNLQRNVSISVLREHSQVTPTVWSNDLNISSAYPSYKEKIITFMVLYFYHKFLCQRNFQLDTTWRTSPLEQCHHLFLQTMCFYLLKVKICNLIKNYHCFLFVIAEVMVGHILASPTMQLIMLMFKRENT